MDRERTPAPVARYGDMSLLEHLGELRRVLVQSLLAWALATAAAWTFSEQAIERLIAPAALGDRPLVFFGPADAFVLRFKVSVGIGLFLAAPIIAWRLWSFVVPGLVKRERAALFPIVVGSLVLFYAGAAFGIGVMLPMSLRFLLGFGSASLQPLLSGEKYFDFLLRIGISFAAVFQFPLVVTILTGWGILPPDFLRRHWRIGVVVVFVVSAILTPPDVVSQLLMAGPLLVLYLVSIPLAKMAARGRGSAEALVFLMALGAAASASAPRAAVAAPALPDLAVRKDGFVHRGSSVDVVVENLGDARSPATELELWDRPPLSGPNGASTPYPPTPGESAVHVFQEVIGRAPAGAVRLTIVVTKGPDVTRTQGSLTLRRGESIELVRATAGASLEDAGRRIVWSADLPDSGWTLETIVPASAGAPPAVELALAPSERGILESIRTADEEIHAPSTMLVLDALDRPAARRVRVDCPALEPGARETLRVDFGSGGGQSEVFAWIDPDDSVREAREGNNVSGIRADSARWTQAALHLHSSFSEGAGSVDWQANLASHSGYDLLAWSEHDWRMACVDHVRRIGFEEDEPIEMTFGSDGGASIAAIGAGARDGVSVLRLAGDAPRAVADLEVKMKRLTYTLASDVSLEIHAMARGLAAEDRLRIVATLSHHPTEMRRLEFTFRPDELGGETWTRLVLPLTTAANERWVNGADDNLTGLRFELIRTGSGGEVLLDDLSVTHGECGAALRRIQESWMRFYPNVAHFFADEVSGQKIHLNQYGGPRGLFDDARTWDVPYVETVVRRAHAAGALISWCHPFGVRTGPDVRERYDAAYKDSLLAERIGDTDILEVGFRLKASEKTPEYLRFWDTAGLRGIATTGIGVNDSHEWEWGPWENNFATWIPAPAEDGAAMQRALAAGRVFFGDPLRFRGRLTIESDGRQGGDARSGKGSRRVTLRVTEAPVRSRVVLVVDGEPIREWTDVSGTRVLSHDLARGEGNVVRAELWSGDGHPLAFTNPIYGEAKRSGE